jgi:hypothetical protein
VWNCRVRRVMNFGTRLTRVQRCDPQDPDAT